MNEVIELEGTLEEDSDGLPELIDSTSDEELLIVLGKLTGQRVRITIEIL